jgi:hypothetical protein
MTRLEILISTKAHYKYDAIFSKNNKIIKIIHFGDNRYSDFTQNHDKKRRDLYIVRHRPRENWDDPMTAGSLSRYILWGDSTNLHKNIKDFRKKFGFE